jgi:hypothetical protein
MTLGSQAYTPVRPQERPLLSTLSIKKIRGPIFYALEEESIPGVFSGDLEAEGKRPIGSHNQPPLSIKKALRCPISFVFKITGLESARGQYQSVLRDLRCG